MLGFIDQVRALLHVVATPRRGGQRHILAPTP
jgi:hypothetical protein